MTQAGRVVDFHESLATSAGLSKDRRYCSTSEPIVKMVKRDLTYTWAAIPTRMLFMVVVTLTLRVRFALVKVARICFWRAEKRVANAYIYNIS